MGKSVITLPCAPGPAVLFGGALNQDKAASKGLRAACLFQSATSRLEAEVAECLVGFGHAVHFVTLLHGTTTAFRGF